MDRDRWQVIERLYHAALARPAGARPAFLAEACEGDEGLRQQVQALLDAPATAEGFFAAPAAAMAAASVTMGTAVREGQQLGMYQLRERIGAGGMGEVYRARDTRLGRDVAIKILPGTLVADPTRLSRFQREARILASLNHPNIATIHGFEEHDGIHALVMELVDGESLAARFAGRPEGRPLRGTRGRTEPSARGVPIHETLTIARQIAEALEAAHEKAIVHRDLKPGNVMLTRGGAVKVLDFGLAKVSAESAAGLTQSPTVTVGGTAEGMVLGTAAYMSPEQARGQEVDKGTDIWAFGCVLYEMVIGRAAFPGETVSDTIAAILTSEPDWTAVPEGTPPAIVRVMRRCLTKDVKRRLRDITDAKIDLEEVVDARHVTLAPPRSSGAGTARMSRLSRAGAPWALAGALLVPAVWAVLPDGSATAPVAVEFSVFPPRGATFPFEAGAPWPSVSPDGHQLAFVAMTSDGQQQLWIRSLDSAAVRPIQGTEGATRPFWAPDSQTIAYFANGKVWRVGLPTGSPRAIADAPYLGGMSATWGSAGTIVLRHVGGLFRVPAEGGAVTLVTRSDASAGEVSTPSFLPDGRQFLFVRERGGREQTQVCVGSLDSMETRCPLTVHSPAQFAPPGHLLFVRDGALRAQPFDPALLALTGEASLLVNARIQVDPVWRPPPFSVSNNGVLAYHPSAGETQVVWQDRSGNPLGTLGTAPGYGGPELSPDETRALITQRDLQSDNVDLWLFDLARGTSSRFTFDPATDTSPVFSPDGERVLFDSDRAGAPGLYLKLTDGTSRDEMFLPGSANPSDWSSDRFVLFQRLDQKTGWDIWAAPLTGDGRPFAVVQTEHGEREGRFSPDARWIAYDSTESGRREIWVQPFPPTGSRWQVSTGGGISPRWRGDGQEIFYVGADGKLMSVAIRTGPTFEFGTATPLFQTMFREGAYGSYTVSRDGQRFLLNAPPQAADITPITVVLNWTARLNR